MSRALPRYRRHEEREADIARIIRLVDTGTVQAKATRGTRLERHRSGEGDPLRLRGWPMVARGVAGMSTESRALLNRIENTPL